MTLVRAMTVGDLRRILADAQEDIPVYGVTFGRESRPVEAAVEICNMRAVPLGKTGFAVKPVPAYLHLQLGEPEPEP